MTALYITLGIIAGIFLLIFILLRISVCAYVNASNDEISVKVKYLWFVIYKLDKSLKKKAPENELGLIDLEDTALNSGSKDGTAETVKKIVTEKLSKKKQKSEADEAENDDELMGVTEESDEKKKGVKEILDEYLPYLPVAKKALRKLLKMIRFYDLDVSIKTGDYDAYKAAMKFGKLNILFYSSLALFCTAFSVHIKRTDLKCDFDDSKTYAELHTIMKVRPSAVLALAVYLGINYLKLKHNQKKKEKRLNKEKEKQNERKE